MQSVLKWIASTGFAAAFACAAPAVEAKDLVFAYVSDSMQFTYDVELGEAFQEACKSLGCKAIVLDGRGSAERQADAIEDLITQKVDGIAMIPVDSVGARMLVDRATNNDILFVAAAGTIGDPNKVPLRQVYSKLTALVTTDDVATGERAGELAARILPKDHIAKIAILEGAPGFAVVRQRTEGFSAALDKAGIKYEVVSSQPTDWSPEKGEAVCQNVLVAHPDVDLFYSQADMMAIGCGRAVQSAGAKVKVIAANGGSRLGNEAIKNGEIYGSVCTRPRLIGKLAAQALFDAATGKTKAKAQFVTYDTPVITKANLSDCPAEW